MKVRSKKGFTLVELLVVIAIVGILAVVATSSLISNIDKAKTTKLISEYSVLKMATISYYTDNNSIEEINENELLEYIDGDIDFDSNRKNGSPYGGYYNLYDKKELNTCISDSTKYWSGRLVNLEDGELEYQKPVELKNENSAFLAVRDVTATKERIAKLVSELGEGNVYVDNKSQTYEYNIIFLKLASDTI